MQKDFLRRNTSIVTTHVQHQLPNTVAHGIVFSNILAILSDALSVDGDVLDITILILLVNIIVERPKEILEREAMMS